MELLVIIQCSNTMPVT